MITCLVHDASYVALQALPGSRLDTNLLKEWLLQHLDSLLKYQSHVAAAEATSRQKQHAAAAAAAARAVYATLEAVFQENTRDDSSVGGPVAAEPFHRVAAEAEALGQGSTALNVQLGDMAVGAATTSAAGSAPSQDQYQVRRGACYYFQLHACMCVCMHVCVCACIHVAHVLLCKVPASFNRHHL